MVDMQGVLEIDSQLQRTWWELSNQLDDLLSHRRVGVLFSIGVATAFLCFVAATVTILESLALWWVTVGLITVGLAILVFVWELGSGELDRLPTLR